MAPLVLTMSASLPSPGSKRLWPRHCLGITVVRIYFEDITDGEENVIHAKGSVKDIQIKAIPEG